MQKFGVTEYPILRRNHLFGKKSGRRARFDSAKSDMLVIRVFSLDDARKLGVQSSRDAALLGERALEYSRKLMPSLHKEAAIAGESDTKMSIKINSAAAKNGAFKEAMLAQLGVALISGKSVPEVSLSKSSTQNIKLNNSSAQCAIFVRPTTHIRAFAIFSCTRIKSTSIRVRWAYCNGTSHAPSADARFNRLR